MNEISDEAVEAAWRAYCNSRSSSGTEAMRAALAAALPHLVAWRPIETLPCEGRCVVILWATAGITIEEADHDSDPAWWAERGATHWLPLPAPPPSATGGEVGRTDFARLASNVAAIAAQWSRDCLMPGAPDEMDAEAVGRFTEELRERLRWIDERARAAGGPGGGP